MYKVNRSTMRETWQDPQVVEVETVEGFVLYIRFNNGQLTCQEKWSGHYLATGNPYLERFDKKLTFDKIEFYLEMYSNHNLTFY